MRIYYLVHENLRRALKWFSAGSIFMFEMKTSCFTWTSYLKKLSSWTFQSNFSSRPTFQTFIVLLRGLFLLQRLVDRYTSP